MANWLDNLRQLFATPSIDVARAAQKEARPRAGRPLAIEDELSVAAGREFIMGISPYAKGREWMFYTVDDIVRKKGGFQEYTAMKKDDAVKAALAFKKVLIYGRSFDVKPASDSAEDKEVADFVQWNLEQAHFKRVIRDALTALEYGFSYGEIMWTLKEYPKGGTCVAFKEVKQRDPDTARFYMDVHGNLVRIEQVDVFGRIVDLPVSKILHYAHEGDFGNPYGESDLRAVYKNWWAKKYLVNFWNTYLERLGAPTLLMKYPEGASSTLQAALRSILSDLGNRAEMLVPQGVQVDVIEGTRAGQATFNEALVYHDSAIGRGILMPALLGIGQNVQRGSDSQSRLQLRTMFKITDEIGREITDLVQDKIIRPLVDYNFDVKEYPTIIWQDYGEYEAFEIADVIRLLHNAGIIDMNQEDVNYVRAIVGLPIRGRSDDEDEVLRPLPAPTGTGGNPPTTPQAGGAAQGNEGSKTGGAGEAANTNRPVRASTSTGVRLLTERVEKLEARLLGEVEE